MPTPKYTPTVNTTTCIPLIREYKPHILSALNYHMWGMGDDVFDHVTSLTR